MKKHLEWVKEKAEEYNGSVSRSNFFPKVYKIGYQDATKSILELIRGRKTKEDLDWIETKATKYNNSIGESSLFPKDYKVGYQDATETILELVEGSRIKKDLEWVKEQMNRPIASSKDIEKGYYLAVDKFNELIDQMEEPTKERNEQIKQILLRIVDEL